MDAWCGDQTRDALGGACDAMYGVLAGGKVLYRAPGQASTLMRQEAEIIPNRPLQRRCSQPKSKVLLQSFIASMHTGDLQGRRIDCEHQSAAGLNCPQSASSAQLSTQTDRPSSWLSEHAGSGFDRPEPGWGARMPRLRIIADVAESSCGLHRRSGTSRSHTTTVAHSSTMKPK